MANQSKNSKWKRIFADQKSESPETLPTSKYSKPLKLQETPFITERFDTDEEREKEDAATKIIGQELERIEADYKRLQSDHRRISAELQQSEVDRAALKCILQYLLSGEDTDRGFRRRVINLINNSDRIEGLTRTMIADIIQQKFNNNTKTKLN